VRVSSLILGLAALVASPAAHAVPPADGFLVWASNREDGRHEIYLQVLATGAVTRLTHEGGKAPRWSPDGRWVSYYHTADNTAHVVRWDGSEDREVCAAAPFKDALAALWPHDNSGLLCMQRVTFDGETDHEYRLFDPESGENELLFRHNEFTHIKGWRFEPGGLTHDGRFLVGWAVGLFRNGHTADNGTFAGEHSTVVLDVQDKGRIYYFGSGCLSATPPAGRMIYHVSRDCPEPPDISRMNLDDLMTRESYALELGYGDAEWGHEYMPDISNDGTWMVYAASLGCHDWYSCDYDVFLHRLGAGTTERVKLVEHPGNDNFPALYVGPAWQADPADADAVEHEHDAGDGEDEPVTPEPAGEAEGEGSEAKADDGNRDGDGTGSTEAEADAAAAIDDDEVDTVTGTPPSPCGCGVARGAGNGLNLVFLGLVLLIRRSATRCARLDASEAKS
jgi:hypothetical protein